MVKREIETSGARIAKQIRILVALVRDALHQYFFFLQVNSIARSRQYDVAARRVVLPRDSEVQKALILAISLGEDRRPARVVPQRIRIVLRPIR